MSAPPKEEDNDDPVEAAAAAAAAPSSSADWMRESVATSMVETEHSDLLSKMEADRACEVAIANDEASVDANAVAAEASEAGTADNDDDNVRSMPPSAPAMDEGRARALLMRVPMKR